MSQDRSRLHRPPCPESASNRAVPTNPDGTGSSLCIDRRGGLQTLTILHESTLFGRAAALPSPDTTRDGTMQPNGHWQLKTIQGTLLVQCLLVSSCVCILHDSTQHGPPDMLPKNTIPQVPLQAYIQNHPKSGQYTTRATPQ